MSNDIKESPVEDVWQISIQGEKAVLTRLRNGKTVESYRPTDKAKAIQDIISIIRGLDPMRNYSSAQNEKNVYQPFEMPVWQAAKIDKNFSRAASCALSVITSVQQTCSMYSEEKNASIQKKRDAFEQTEIYKKAVEIEKLAEEALSLIKPAEFL